MKELGTIEQEAAECRAAFQGVAVGAPVWCCHHDMLFEFLDEPAGNRVRYVLSNKPFDEQARRLREFRPVRDVQRHATLYSDYEAKRAPLDADYEAKRAPLDADYKAKRVSLDADYEAKRVSLYSDYDAKRTSLDADYEAKLASLDADYEAKRAPLDADLAELHLSECPGTAWNGKDIFGSAG